MQTESKDFRLYDMKTAMYIDEVLLDRAMKAFGFKTKTREIVTW